MPTESPHPNLLLVEGRSDLHVVIHLMRRHANWPLRHEADRMSDCPFRIEEYRGVPHLTRGFLSLRWKEEGKRAMGVVIDADDEPMGRYQHVKGLVTSIAPSMPSAPSAGGIILETEDGKRFGVWLMPDNQSPGAIEGFLGSCVSRDQDHLWAYAKEAVDHAFGLIDIQSRPDRDKARVRTFLAWQDPPGDFYGAAISAGVFDAGLPLAQSFSDWCIRLFDLKQ